LLAIQKPAGQVPFPVCIICHTADYPDFLRPAKATRMAASFMSRFYAGIFRRVLQIFSDSLRINFSGFIC